MRKTPMGTCQQPCSVVRDPSGTPFVVSKNNTCKRSFGGITIKIHYKIKYLKVPTYDDAFPLCSPFGRLRTVAGVRSELMLLFSLIEESDDAMLHKLLQPLRSHLDDIFAPVGQAEAMHAELLRQLAQQSFDALGLAWHHAHLSYQSPPKHKRDHQHESQQWLNVAEGILENQFELLQVLVFEKLNAMVQASSLVELVNAFIRPSLNSSKGHITQETFNLIMFYHNHRRYKSGKRPVKAPIELLTGEALDAAWVALLIQHTQAASQGPSLTSR